MNRLLRELHVLMERKLRLYDKFIALLGEQWTCITEYSLERLQGINGDKEKMVDDMQRLEKDRSFLMLTIERKLSAPPGLTLKKLIRMQNDPMNVALAQSRERLLKQIGMINELHQRIKSLTDHSSLSLKKSMAFIHAAGEAAISPYHANGQIVEGKIEGRMLSVDA